MDGTLGRIRTCDLLIRSQLLYPTELPGHVSTILLSQQPLHNLSTISQQPLNNLRSVCRADRILHLDRKNQTGFVQLKHRNIKPHSFQSGKHSFDSREVFRQGFFAIPCPDNRTCHTEDDRSWKWALKIRTRRRSCQSVSQPRSIA